jgi:hypothetical protein
MYFRQHRIAACRSLLLQSRHQKQQLSRQLVMPIITTLLSYMSLHIITWWIMVRCVKPPHITASALTSHTARKIEHQQQAAMIMLMTDGDSASHDDATTPRPHFEEFDSTAAAAVDAGHDAPRAVSAHASAVESQALVLEELGHLAVLHTPPPPRPPASMSIKVVNRSR